METFRKLILASVAVLAFCMNAVAWDDSGHQLAAMIAWDVMSPAARERAFRILMSAPEDSDLNVQYSAFNSRSDSVKQLELFMFAGTWPDVIRNRGFETRYRNYHHSNWHYAGIFWKGDGVELKDFPEPSGIAIEKLGDFEATLRSSSAPDSEKAVALAWFLHVAADIHNPLHNASRVTDSEPKGDQGGNLFLLEPKKEDGSFALNLHSFWDSQITRNVPRQNDASDVDYLRPIEKIALAMYPPSGFNGHLKLSGYAEWNREGFELLPGSVYSGVVREKMPDDDYSSRAFRISLKKITLAGNRIGRTLNAIFDPQGTTASLFRNVSDCRIIRTIPYPFSKRTSQSHKEVAALLDICPPDSGMVARPTITLDESGSSAGYEFDVLVVFEDNNAALKYAKANHIEDVRIDR